MPTGSPSQIETSYWLWAAITAQDAPTGAECYVYQGLISTNGQQTVYERIGLFPHPLKAKKLFLVYRLGGELPEPQKVVSTFVNGAGLWQRHPLVVKGLQLDFDSPTAKLLIYSDFLQKVRQLLPKQYDLSITGLSDWTGNGSSQAMQAMAKATDEVVFQLYQGWKPLPNIGAFVQRLTHYPLSFRVGLLAASKNDDYIRALTKNPHFKGVIYFIQKHHPARLAH